MIRIKFSLGDVALSKKWSFGMESKGTPIIRPMFVEYPNDNIAADLDKQFHVGPGLLVAGITMPNQQEIPIYLPEAIWYDYHTFQKINENGAISYKTNENWVPVFIKGGNVIIRYEKAKMSTSDMKSDPISIIIVLNKEKKAKGMIYSLGTHLRALTAFRKQKSSLLTFILHSDEKNWIW